jgi:hypothetical protein
VLPVRPAADVFPLMSEADLRVLGEDIKKNGLREPIAIYRDDVSQYSLLDGRNRLDAMELVGVQFELALVKGRRERSSYWDLTLPNYDGFDTPTLPINEETDDPYGYVISANIHRRHLTVEQKRELIGKLLKADPTKSDRAIAKTTKTDHKTVASVRAKKERRGEIPHVKTRTDTKGRKQPAEKRKAAKKSPNAPKKPLPDCPVCKGEGTVMGNIYGPCGTKESSQPICIPCPCTQWKRRGNPTLYDDLRRWGEEAIAREKRGGTAFDAPSATAAEPEAIPPTATTAKSWKVEAIAKDGRRYGNGVRLGTEDVADAYRGGATIDLLRDGEDTVIAIATEVIPCADERTAEMKRGKAGNRKGRFTGELGFLHGTCGTLEWQEIATPAKVEPKPKVQQRPIQIIDDGTDGADQGDGPQQFWERSLANVAGVAISLEASWTRQHGAAWRDFPVSRDLATLAREAADA